jgi:2-C-methyl-D-erythritol 4-phosphate cytidylyltransferase
MSQNPLKTWAVLTAGGQSQRFQAEAETQGIALPSNKLLSLLNDKPVLAHSLRALLDSMAFEGVVITASRSAMPDFQVIVDAVQVDFPTTPICLVEGGADRRASVFEGLSHIHSLLEGTSPDAVVIHDGARPLLPLDFLASSMHVLEASLDLQGVIAGHPLSDTIKRSVERDGVAFIEGTVARQALWAVQTPQVFRWQPLWKAHQTVPWDASITDDAELVERHLGTQSGLGLLRCSRRNLKITTPEDLALAHFWLNR